MLIISLHRGMEYDTIPSPKTAEEAHQIIDWAADMVIGHHTHVIQGIEIYQGNLIDYSLGNFILTRREWEQTGVSCYLADSGRKHYTLPRSFPWTA